MAEQERWEAVRGYEGIYEVSSLGRVKRIRAGKGCAADGASTEQGRFERLLRPIPFGHYLAVRLSDLPGKRPPKTVHVHQLVLQAFQGPCPPGYEARHLNDLPHDNREANLLWGTRQENARDACRNNVYGGKLCGLRARAVCRLAVRGRINQRSIARWFGVSQPVVSNIRLGRSWGWLTEDIRAEVVS